MHGPLWFKTYLIKFGVSSSSSETHGKHKAFLPFTAVEKLNTKRRITPCLCPPNPLYTFSSSRRP